MAGRDFVRRGYFVTKWNGQPVRLYQCALCRRWVSRQRGRPSYRQHRPDLNQKVLELYASGMTQRRMAIVLGVNRKTIARKLVFIAKLAREAHQEELNRLRTGTVQFDEMLTFEHSKLKPVTIVLAVRARNGQIIDAQAAAIPYRGPLASIARRKYGYRPNHAARAIKATLESVNACRKPGLRVLTDCHPLYPRYLRQHLGNVSHLALKRENPERTTDRRNPNDRLFTLNYTCAKLRNDLSRLSRKTWVTTKRIDRLQAHLDLYIAFNNGYRLHH